MAALLSAASSTSLVSLSSLPARTRSSPTAARSRLCLRASVQLPEQNEGGETPKSSPAAAKLGSSSFSEVFAFSGQAPETINGRLAMVGFAAAIGVEAATGHPLLFQIQNGGVPWFLVTGILITAASLVPMLKGVTTQSTSGTLMSAQAETWNGRAAMLGLVALAVTEFVKAGPLI